MSGRAARQRLPEIMRLGSEHAVWGGRVLRSRRQEDAATLPPREAVSRLQGPLRDVAGSGGRAHGTEGDLAKDVVLDLEMNCTRIAPFGREVCARVVLREWHLADGHGGTEAIAAWRTQGCPVSGHDADARQAVVHLPDGRAGSTAEE